MNKNILRFGLYSAALLIGASIITWVTVGTTMDFGTSELVGYLTMFVAMIFVFFGVKTYRDEQNGGVISFGKALGVGTLIALVPSVAFGIYSILFFTLQGDKWLAYARENMPAEQWQQYQAAPAFLMNPLFQGFIMFLTVFLIGFGYAIISALLVQRKTAPVSG